MNEPAAGAPAVLEVMRPSLPSRKYDLAALRGIAEGGSLPLSKLVADTEVPAASIVVVTSGSGALSVFSFAEISSSLPPALDLSGAAPRLVAAPGRGLDGVVSIELRVLRP